MPLTEQLVLMTGVGVLAGEIDAGDGGRLSIVEARVPVELEVYLRRPVPGALAPTLRAGAAFGYRWFGSNGLEEPQRELHLSALAGLTYFVSSSFGVSAEGGVEYQRSWQQDGIDGWMLGIGWRAGAVFRL